jgi:ribosomal protein S18 acetylase RimI-like enzyme
MQIQPSFYLREAVNEDIPSLRLLLNASYKELSDQGLNYTATYQDEAKTAERIAQGRAFVVEHQQKIVATILFFVKNYFTDKNTAYIGQFAVSPELKRQGIGTKLMQHCEDFARAEGFEGLQLDTAKPALHLVEWYQKQGYVIVGEIHWEGKTYDSYIFEKLF